MHQLNAFGHPGIEPRWTSSSKEAVCTAYSTSSRVWFTLSHGILNEVYYPTIDRPQVRDLQLLITDGATFFHEERRDLTSEVHCLEGDTLGYHAVLSDPDGRYRITKQIITDPYQPCVLMQVRIETADQWQGKLQCYALLAPHLEMGGWNNSARSYFSAGKKVLVAWKGRVHMAFGVSTRFTKTSCGYAGYSDGWQDLKDNFLLDWQFDQALNGNVAMIGQIDIGQSAEFTLCLAFGAGLQRACTTLAQSLSVPFVEQRKAFVGQWRRHCCEMAFLEHVTHDKGLLSRVSYNLLLAHEDKTFAGAIIASASIPWGDFKGDEDIGGYHLVWTRDMINSATALLACRNTATPRRALVYLACSQLPDGGFPQNFWLDGKPYWTGIQLDEVAFPIILAWRLWKADGLAEFDPYPMVMAAARYLIRQGPITEQERWEEASGYSPSTLAATIAALICAADFARARGRQQAALYIEEYADFLEAHIETWTVTTQGTLLAGVPRHFIRIHPVAKGAHLPAEDIDQGLLTINNQPPGVTSQYVAKDIVDAGFLELVRYGIRRAGDSLIEDSLRVIDHVLKVETPHGPCWHRYNHDGYGNRTDGGPFEGWGQGRAWPLLTGERGHYELAAGRDVTPYVKALEGFAFKGKMLPEQIWDEERPELGMRIGLPTGSAMPLMWAHAEYLKLLRSVHDGVVFDRIAIVAERYGKRKGRRDLEIWQPLRQIQKAMAGQTLRIQAPAAFRLRWSNDDWLTIEETTATDSGLGIFFTDIALAEMQTRPVQFTFFWLEAADTAFFRRERESWEGRDYVVEVMHT
jgi:glucoamylase